MPTSHKADRKGISTNSTRDSHSGQSLEEALVSVIIVTFDGADDIIPCLASLVDQTHPKVEVIVVDNASQDSTTALIRTHYPAVTILENEENLGFAGGNNVGIAKASGDYIAFLNQDARADPRWLEASLAALAEHPAAGMCAAKILYTHDPQRINSTGVLLYRDLSTVNRGLDELDQGQYDSVEEVFCAYGAAAVFKREVLEDTGGFDAGYFLLHEEDDLAWRARFYGWQCVYAPAAIVYHRRSASLELYSRTKLYYGERNRLWNVVKYLPWPQIALAFAFTGIRYCKMLQVHVGGESTKARRTSKVGTWQLVTTLFRAWLDGLRGLPSALRKRRCIWRHRRVPKQAINGWLKRFSARLDEVTEK